MSDDYGDIASEGAEMRRSDPGFATQKYREAAHLAARSGHSFSQIRDGILRGLRPRLTESGAKSQATKIATVALWLRRGNEWPDGRGLTPIYNMASGTGKVTCPNCSHRFTP